MNNEDFHLQMSDEDENFDLSVDDRVENFNLTPDENVESFGLSPNDEDEEFTVEFGEIINDGGTHDYNELDNKPQINGHTLEGDKTGDQLGLQDEINDLDTIRSGAAKGASAVQPHDLARVATTGSYNDLNNKPSIPTVNDGTLTIQRNGSTIASFTANSSINRTANISVPTATSQLTNDSGYTTNTGTITSVKMNGNTVATSGEANLGTVITDVSEKQNITDNALETNNKTVPGAINEVNSIAKGANQALSFSSYPYMINDFNVAPNDEYQIGQNVMIVTISVPDLWVSGIESTSVRYTYRGDSAFLSELSENGYVQVGYYKLSALETQKVDLTGYVKNTDYASSSNGGVIKISSDYATAVNNGVLYAQDKTYTDYANSAYNGMVIGKGTLENVITGKGLVSNTDYAGSTGGVFRTNANYGTNIDASGYLRGVAKSYSDYDSTHNLALICKSTLENVITGKRLTANKNYYGTCSTAASQAAKVVVCKGFVLETGAHISVEFVNSCNVSGTVTLNVNSTGAVDIANVGTEKNIQRIWQPGEIVDFVYDGTNYVIVKGGFATTVFYGLTKLSDSTSSTSTDLAATANSVKTAYDLANGKQDPLTAGTGINITNNVISATGGGGTGNNVFYGTCATGATTAAKVIVCEDFTASDLVAGTRLTVYFTNANTYNGQATLNVNGTGAKNLYYNGTTANARYMWVSGESVEFVYNGEQWATVNGGLASTTYYGVTKLLTSAASDSQSVALTPRSLYYLANYSIAPFYSTSSTYAVGDKVRYTYYLYECITAIETPEAWNAAHWQQIDTLQEQIDALEARIRALENSQ